MLEVTPFFGRKSLYYTLVGNSAPIQENKSSVASLITKSTSLSEGYWLSSREKQELTVIYSHSCSRKEPSPVACMMLGAHVTKVIYAFICGWK